MAQFSGVIKLSDLNDFIAPSQACVVSLGKAPAAQKFDEQVGEVQLQQRKAAAPPGGGLQQTVRAADSDAIKVTLHDCLACSGCVTSAETVLLQHQSTEEFRAKLAEPGVTVIVSVSPQSRASLAGARGAVEAVQLVKRENLDDGYVRRRSDP